MSRCLPMLTGCPDAYPDAYWVRSLFIWLHKNSVIEVYWSIDVWEEVFEALKRNQPHDEMRIRLALTEKVIASYPECLVQTPKFAAIGLQDLKGRTCHLCSPRM